MLNHRNAYKRHSFLFEPSLALLDNFKKKRRKKKQLTETMEWPSDLLSASFYKWWVEIIDLMLFLVHEICWCLHTSDLSLTDNEDKENCCKSFRTEICFQSCARCVLVLLSWKLVGTNVFVWRSCFLLEVSLYVSVLTVVASELFLWGHEWGIRRKKWHNKIK